MRPARFHVYKGRNKQWFIRFRAKGNSRLQADLGESYIRKAGALAAIKRIKAQVPTAEVVIEQ